MFATIVDCAPEDVVIGLPVTVVFDPVGEALALPKFRPEGPE
jgi:hypothetical protein